VCKSLDELEELALAEAAPGPQEGKKYDRDQLVAKRKTFEAKVPRKGFFMARKIAAREISRVRHDKLVIKAERRIALKKDRHVFNLSVKPFDDAVARIDFEIGEIDKDLGRPPKDDEGEKKPKRKRAKSSSPRSSKGKSVRRSKRTRRSPGKYREPMTSEDEDSEEDSEESWEEEGDEGEDGDSLSSLNERLARLQEDPIDRLPQVPQARPMSAPVQARV